MRRLASHRSRRSSLVATTVALAALTGSLLTPGADAAAPSTDRVSVSSAEVQGNGSSENPSLSADARLTAFQSGASNLVPGDGNNGYDVFVRDRHAGVTEIASLNSAGNQGNSDSRNPSMSPDGRFVGFDSEATNLVSGDTNAATDVFLRDRTSASTARVSVTDGGGQANDASRHPSVSRDGLDIAFESLATNLGMPGGPGWDIFVRDRATNSTELVSRSSQGAPGNADSFNPDITPSGRHVAFESDSTTLVAGDTNNRRDIFVRDREDGTTDRVSLRANGGQANAHSRHAAISADSRYVAFESDASNLVSDDTNGTTDIFVRDRAVGTTLRVSVASDGQQANGPSMKPAVSGDGRFVAFQSDASNLVPGDTNGTTDVFVHDILTGVTRRVSVGSQANGASAEAALADHTPVVAFQSDASNLVTGDTNGLTDVFARQYFVETGYYILDDVGGIFTFGQAQFFGSVPSLINAGHNIGPAKAIDLAGTPTGAGYYVLDEVGGIFTFGDAEFFGSLPGLRAQGVPVGDAPAIDIAVTASGRGYYILDSQGGVHTFGDAQFQGSLPGLRDANVPIGDSMGVDLAANPAGSGYYILDNVGGIFAFGDAQFFGSVPGLRQSGIPIGQAPSIRLEVTDSGLGYMVLDDVGGIFSFGDANFHGSIPGLKNAGVPIGDATGVDISMTPGSGGYLILDDVGGIFAFGDAEFLGSVPSLREAGVEIGPARSIRLDIVAGVVGD